MRININAETVTAGWPLSGVSVGPAFSTFPARASFTVHADQGTFVAKVDSHPRPVAEADRRLSVLEYLAARNFVHAPALLRTRSGGRLVHTGSMSISLLEFIPGELPEGSWADLGRAAAKLNGHTDYAVPFQIPIDAALAELARWVDGRPFERAFLRLLDRVSQLQGVPSTGLIHGEINEANARRRTDGTVVLLDWDEAGTGPTVLEYGYPLITTFLSEDLAFCNEAAAAFYEGYLDAGASIDRSTVFSSALFHALRYISFGNVDRRWGRVCYALDHEDELCAVIPRS